MRNARQAAAQKAAIDAQQAYKRVKANTAVVEQHMELFGDTGLVDLCCQFAGHDNTTKTSILIAVQLKLGREARDAVREVLPCF